jgi:hypothetical protein
LPLAGFTIRHTENLLSPDLLDRQRDRVRMLAGAMSVPSLVNTSEIGVKAITANVSVTLCALFASRLRSSDSSALISEPCEGHAGGGCQGRSTSQ